MTEINFKKETWDESLAGIGTTPSRYLYKD